MMTMKSNRMAYPVTPDGRYFVVNSRLWRCTNPDLPEDTRQKLVAALMQARRLKDRDAIEAAHQAIDVAKRKLGERGDVWWTDGAPDWNERMAKDNPCADWFRTVME
jgi:hypothetical protein